MGKQDRTGHATFQQKTSMFARIHEAMKEFYGDTLCLRLLELIPAAVILASFVCHACLTYENPREVLAAVLVPCFFFQLPAV